MHSLFFGDCCLSVAICLGASLHFPSSDLVAENGISQYRSSQLSILSQIPLPSAPNRYHPPYLCFLASICLPHGQQALFSVNRTRKQDRAVTEPLGSDPSLATHYLYYSSLALHEIVRNDESCVCTTAL